MGKSGRLMSEDPGDFKITFGRKYKGTRIGDIPIGVLWDYVRLIEGSVRLDNSHYGTLARGLRRAVEKLPRPIEIDVNQDPP